MVGPSKATVAPNDDSNPGVNEEEASSAGTGTPGQAGIGAVAVREVHARAASPKASVVVDPTVAGVSGVAGRGRVSAVRVGWSWGAGGCGRVSACEVAADSR